jgi:hypothetical protein
MDVGFLLRMKGVVEAAAAVPPSGRAGQGHAEAYPRVRELIAEAVDDDTLRAEMDRLFPADLSTAGRPWNAQGDEAVVLMNLLAGWLGGLVEEAVLGQRIRAEAEERAKQVGFG